MRLGALRAQEAARRERRLLEYEVPWLKGYEGAAPVRIGNAAADQLQLDVYVEVLDSLYQARRMGLPAIRAAWGLERALVEHLETVWEQARRRHLGGPPRQFTHSKAMAWVAFDRAIRSVEEFGLDGHVALINTAHNLTRAYGPAQHRAETKETIGHNTDTAERLA